MAHDYDDEVQTPDAPISMNKEWRPENPLKGVMVIDHSFEHGKYLGFEHGASAMLVALIKWLFEPCTEHVYPLSIMCCNHGGHGLTKDGACYLHRKDCPQCMESFKKMEAKDGAI
jgi:hypothetical protein